MPVCDAPDLLDLAGRTVEMGNHNELRVRIKREGLLQRFGTHVPGVILGVDKDGLAVLIGDGVDGGVKGRVAAEDAVAPERSLVRARLTVKPLAGELRGQMQRRRAR